MEPAGTPSPQPGELLPPNEADTFAALYEEDLRPLGVRLTRSGLVDRTDGKFEYTPEGTHLAIYVEPVGSATTADYVNRIVSVTRVFASTIFDRWPGLETFDVCQEPPPGVDDAPEPTPFTQVDMHRDAAAKITWETATLTDLLVLARDTTEDEDGMRQMVVSTNSQVADHPTFEAAKQEAREATAGA